jgi:hypothetical protein
MKIMVPFFLSFLGRAACFGSLSPVVLLFGFFRVLYNYTIFIRVCFVFKVAFPPPNIGGLVSDLDDQQAAILILPSISKLSACLATTQAL